MKPIILYALIFLLSLVLFCIWRFGNVKPVASKPLPVIVITDSTNYKTLIVELQSNLQNCYQIIDSLKIELKTKRYEIIIVKDSSDVDSSGYIPEYFRKLSGYFSGEN